MEIRSSGGDTCPRCGSFEIMRVNSNGRELAADFGPMVEQVCRAREAALLEGIEAERERWRARVERGADDLQEVLAAIAGRPSRRWRLFRRRWEKSLAERVDAVVHASAKGPVEAEDPQRGV